MERRKVHRLNQNQKYDEMECRPASEAAVEAFNRPAYQSISVLEYLAGKYKIRGDFHGQRETETIQSIEERTGIK